MAITDYPSFQQSATKLTQAEIRRKQLEIIDAYNQSLRRVRKQIQGLYLKELSTKNPQDYYNIAIQFNRLSKLEKNIAFEVAALNKQITGLTADASRIAISNNYYRQQYVTNWMDPYSFTVLPQPAVNYAVFNRAVDFKNLTKEAKIFATNKQGTTLKTVLRDNNILAIKRINQTLNQGLIQGSSYRQMASSLRETFGKNLNNSLRVVRTETHRTLNQGELYQWEDAKKKGVQGNRMVLSVLDSRTRPQSVSVDGKKENEFGLFNYPDGRTGKNGVASPGNSGVAAWDINDRETVINLIDGKSPKLRRGRNPLTGKNEVFNFKDYNEWAKEKGLIKNKSGQYIAKKVKPKKKTVFKTVKKVTPSTIPVKKPIQKSKPFPINQVKKVTTESQAQEMQDFLRSNSYLTRNDISVINKYTGAAHSALNKTLRTGNKDFTGMSGRLTRGLNKIVPYEGQTFRGEGYSNFDDFTKMINKHVPKEVIERKEFLSTSIKKSVADAFKKGDTYRIEYFLKTKTGKPIWRYSKYPQEREVLQNKKSTFYVEKVERVNDSLYKIYYEEV